MTTSTARILSQRVPNFGLIFSFAVGISGCSYQTVPNPKPTPATQTEVKRPDSTQAVVGAAWDIYQPGSLQYDYRLTSAIQVVAGDSVPRTDSSRVTALLTVTFSNSTVQQIVDVSVKADSIRTVSLPVIPGVPGPIQTEFHPLQFSKIINRVLPSQSPVQECSDNTVELMLHGDEVLPSVAVREGRKFWADTSTIAVCRAGVRLQLNRVARFQLDDSEVSAPARRIFRTAEVTVTGTGIQWQQPVQITGTGTAVDTLVLRQNPARLHTVSGAAQLNIEFRSPTRHQQFIQKTLTSITAR